MLWFLAFRELIESESNLRSCGKTFIKVHGVLKYDIVAFKLISDQFPKYGGVLHCIWSNLTVERSEVARWRSVVTIVG